VFVESGQAELSVLWGADVERFSGRRVAAALSFLLVPLVGAVGWIVQGPAVGITAAALLFGCFTFLVAFAMAHRDLCSIPAPPRVSASEQVDDESSPAVGWDDRPPGTAGTVSRLAG
jgi:hypothetical protein